MPAPTPLNYAESYQSALANAFPYKLYFGELFNLNAAGRYRWVDAKTIQIPRLTTTGRVAANRSTIGSATRNYDNDWETKTLENQRKWSTLVHPMDISQTNMVGSIANITKTFNEFQKFPEMDAYCISSLYSAWTTSVSSEGYVGHTASTASTATGDDILAEFDAMMLRMDNARVPLQGRVLYITNEKKAALKNAASLTRTWDVQVQTAGGINRNVEYLDGVLIKAVPAELMKTAYNFTSGWAVDGSAAQINMFLVNPIAVITPISYAFAQLEAPSALSEGKWVYYEESFEDVFILNKQADALQFNITP